MDDAMEASSQRIRHHLRRPLAGRRDLLNETAGNTLNETDPGSPKRALDQLVLEGWCYPRDTFLFETHLLGCIRDYEEVNLEVKALLLLLRIAAEGGAAMTLQDDFFEAYVRMPITLDRLMERNLMRYLQEHQLGP